MFCQSINSKRDGVFCVAVFVCTGGSSGTHCLTAGSGTCFGAAGGHVLTRQELDIEPAEEFVTLQNIRRKKQ